jgi:hypothetical protein
MPFTMKHGAYFEIPRNDDPDEQKRLVESVYADIKLHFPSAKVTIALPDKDGMVRVDVPLENDNEVMRVKMVVREADAKRIGPRSKRKV